MNEQPANLAERGQEAPSHDVRAFERGAVTIGCVIEPMVTSIDDALHFGFVFRVEECDFIAGGWGWRDATKASASEAGSMYLIKLGR